MSLEGTVTVIAYKGYPGRRGRRAVRGHDAAGHTQDPDLGLPQRGGAAWPRAGRRSTTYVRHLFLHPTAHDLFRDWDTQTRGSVTRLGAYTGTHPDPGYGLIAKLRVVQPELEALPPDAASIELPQTWPVVPVVGAAGSGVAAA
jgi:hypothetical protein